MKKVIIIKLFLVLSFSITLLGFQKNAYTVYFDDYEVTIHSIPKIGDTINYNKNSIEDFKFVFYDIKGKCYCERYLNKKLYEKGYFENSLDTLKRYVSGRYSNGKSSAIKVQDYFQPLKNGEWVIYKKGKKVKEIYVMGILQ